MLLLSIFEIPYRERLAKNVNKRYVQVIPRSTAQQPKTRSAYALCGCYALLGSIYYAACKWSNIAKLG